MLPCSSRWKSCSLAPLSLHAADGRDHTPHRGAPGAGATLRLLDLAFQARYQLVRTLHRLRRVVADRAGHDVEVRGAGGCDLSQLGFHRLLVAADRHVLDA